MKLRWIVLFAGLMVGMGRADATLPWSFQHAVTGDIPRVVLSAPSAKDLVDPDSLEKGSRRIGFFRPLPKPLRSRDQVSGARPVWSRLADGRSLLVWMVESPQAMGIRAELLFDKIPSGSEIIAYDPNRPRPGEWSLRSWQHRGGRSLVTETVFAENIIIEMILPARFAAKDLDVRLERIIHVYDFPNPLEKAGACHGDPNCYTE